MLGLFWDHVGIILGSFWDHFGILSGSFWDNVGIILGSFWNHFWIIWGSYWNHWGIILGYFWNHFGICLRWFWSNFGIIILGFFDWRYQVGSIGGTKLVWRGTADPSIPIRFSIWTARTLKSVRDLREPREIRDPWVFENFRVPSSMLGFLVENPPEYWGILGRLFWTGRELQRPKSDNVRSAFSWWFHVWL